MSSPFIPTTLHVFDTLAPAAWRAVRLSVGGSREDHGARYVLLCIWERKGGILAELALTESEYCDLMCDLMAAAPKTASAWDEEEGAV